MAAIILNDVIIDLTDATDYLDFHNDNAKLTVFDGDDHSLRVKVGNNSFQIRAPLHVMMMIMDAIADEISYKTVPLISDKTKNDAECLDEYFDLNGNYINKNKAH